MPNLSESKHDLSPSPARIEAVVMLSDFQKRSESLSYLFAKNSSGGKLNPRDRNLLYELVFGTIRWRIQLDWILRQFVHGSLDDLPVYVQNILRLGLYQLRFSDKIPDYAVINEAVSLTRVFSQIKFSRMVNGIFRNYLRKCSLLCFPTAESGLSESLMIKHSFPQWMVELFIDQYGAGTAEDVLISLNRRPKITIRVNTKKKSVEEFLVMLERKNIQGNPSKYFSEFININGPVGKISDLPGYEDGCFSIQDESAGIASHLARFGEFSTVADICAAPGGKITHLAGLLEKNVNIFGLDISGSRIALITENLKRMKLESINLVQADGKQLPFSKIDMIIIDAPCSGLGVIRKNPDIKLRRKPEELINTVKLQFQLLKQAAGSLNQGGVLIYSTCTINKNENEKLIDKFLSTFKEFRIENASSFLTIPWVNADGWIKTIPGCDNLDGSFCIRLRKGS